MAEYAVSGLEKMVCKERVAVANNRTKVQQLLPWLNPGPRTDLPAHGRPAFGTQASGLCGLGFRVQGFVV